jgi:hypothetical protein
MLGSYRVNEQGEIHFIFKGDLLKDLKEYALFYQEDAEKVKDVYRLRNSGKLFGLETDPFYLFKYFNF